MSGNAYGNAWKYMERSKKHVLKRRSRSLPIVKHTLHLTCPYILKMLKISQTIKRISSKIEKQDLHFTKSQGAKTLYLK